METLHSVVAADPWQGIYRDLRTRILRGEFAPGQRLVESVLADEFATSRGPVRSALKELERVGLVVVVPRRGTFIRTYELDDVDEILSLWDLIWPFTVRRAAERMTPADFERLRVLTSALPAADDPEALIAYAKVEHRMMFELSGHRRVLEVYDSLALAAESRLMLLIGAGRWSDLRLGEPAPHFYRALVSGEVDRAIEISSQWTQLLRAFLGERSSPADTVGSDQAAS